MPEYNKYGVLLDTHINENKISIKGIEQELSEIKRALSSEEISRSLAEEFLIYRKELRKQIKRLKEHSGLYSEMLIKIGYIKGL